MKFYTIKFDYKIATITTFSQRVNVERKISSELYWFGAISAVFMNFLREKSKELAGTVDNEILVEDVVV